MNQDHDPLSFPSSSKESALWSPKPSESADKKAVTAILLGEFDILGHIPQ